MSVLGSGDLGGCRTGISWLTQNRGYRGGAGLPLLEMVPMGLLVKKGLSLTWELGVECLLEVDKGVDSVLVWGLV